jgi:tripartite-type tricarboxylate transporter receptor subunit TctC
MKFLRSILSSMAVAALSAASTTVFAVDYPIRPITIVMPFATGGGFDATARALARGMQAEMGQPVIVENKVGASGTIAANFVKQAPADGYTLLVGTTNLLSFPRSVMPGLAFNPQAEFVPISGLSRSDLVVVVPASSPARNMKDLVELARRNPGKLSYGSYGIATTTHFCIEELKRRTNTHLVHVPYRGAPTTDVVGGQLNVACDVIPAVLPLARAGRLRILGVAAPTRSSFMPDVPTVAEQGFEGFSIFTWSGLVAPKGTPASVIDKLSKVVAKVGRAAEFQSQLNSLSNETWLVSPAELGSFIGSETVKWQKLVTEAQIKLD